MIANRVPGPTSPEPNRNPAANKVQREQAQRVEKVREIDPDEQAKQRRRDQFNMMMQSKEEAESTAPRVPSPFETTFYSTEGTQDGSSATQNAIPGPAYSPPPRLDPPIQETSEDGALPQSSSFWHSVNLPDQPPPTQREITEGSITPQEKGKASQGSSMNASLKGTPSAGPNSSGSAHPAKDLKKQSSTAKGDLSHLPSGRFWTPEGEQALPESKGVTKGTSKAKQPLGLPSPSIDGQEIPSLPSKTPSFAMPMDGDVLPEAKGEKEKSKGTSPDKFSSGKKAIDITPPLPPLPSNVQATAIAAISVASPYLSPETLPLFYQMVGSILVMSTPQGGNKGLTRYEVALNSPAFAQSRFYGSTIEIIRYSTAPDAYNIRLSGSNEAVHTFNQNIPSLLASFQESLQRGSINFRIGRLEASYTNDRPVFRRRDREKGSSSGGGDLGRGNN
jgi:hypothetical protein